MRQNDCLGSAGTLTSAGLCLLVLTTWMLPARCQTCVIMNVSSGEIVIGADSKATHKTLVDSGNTFSLQKSSLIKSKIREAGNFYYSLSDDLFSVDSIISKVASGNTSFDMFVQLSRYKIQDYLNTVLEQVRQKDSLCLKKNFPESQITEIIFCGSEKNVPRAIVVWFGLSPDLKLPISVSSGFKEIENNHIAVGLHGAFEKEFDNNEIWARGTAEALRYFIHKQIDFSPDELSEPIIILKLTRNKAEWLSGSDVNKK